jgi:hypothetical protein
MSTQKPVPPPPASLEEFLRSLPPGTKIEVIPPPPKQNK